MSRTFGDTRIYNDGAELKVRESNSCVSLTQFDIYLLKKEVVHILEQLTVKNDTCSGQRSSSSRILRKSSLVLKRIFLFCTIRQNVHSCW